MLLSAALAAPTMSWGWRTPTGISAVRISKEPFGKSYAERDLGKDNLHGVQEKPALIHIQHDRKPHLDDASLSAHLKNSIRAAGRAPMRARRGCRGRSGAGTAILGVGLPELKP